MNFFEKQNQARSQTKWLIFLFAISVVAIIFILNITLYYSVRHLQPTFRWSENSPLFLFTSLGILITIILGSAYKFYSLSQGGISVALMMGGKSIDPQTTEPHERRLLNIVEEMALAAGVAVPEVFVLENENGINAFAAGFKRKDAVITVTQGTLNLLSRDELQGVIAHEFSHILNEDIKLNMQLLGLTSGIAILSHTGRMLLNASPRRRFSARSKGNGGLLGLGLVLYLTGLIGVLFAKLIKAAVSRQREFLADASAVQFTRNPDGLSGALKKIGGAVGGSAIKDSQAEEISHFFFSASGLNGGGWLSTHPNLTKRIRAIEPRFNGKFPEIVIPAAPPQDVLTDYDRKVMAKGKFVALSPEAWAASVGTIPKGESPLTEISEHLRNSARDPFSSQFVLYALFLSNDTEHFEMQMNFLKPKVSPEALSEIAINRETIQKAAVDHLSILNLCIPSLKFFSSVQFQELLQNLKGLCEADRKLSLLEYASLKLVKSSRTGKRAIQFHSMEAIKSDLIIFLSSLAYAGHGKSPEAAESFSAAARKLQLPALNPVDLKDCGLKAFDDALDRLSLASPLLKRKVLDASIESILWDKKTTQSEAALLGVAAAVMEIPLPPYSQA